MAYLDIESKNFLQDILSRKEFYSYKVDPNRITYENKPAEFTKIDQEIRDKNHLMLYSSQHLLNNFLGPNTEYNRLLVRWSTGSGKTATALSIAGQYLNILRKQWSNGERNIGSIFIFGFSKQVFQRELLKYPKFGFINREELEEYTKLKRTALDGSEIDTAKLRDFETKIKKRFSKRNHGGFFKFYGYKEFVNRLFIPANNIDINKISKDDLCKFIADGSIKLDQTLVAGFKDSLIICDEIHNVYNSCEPNNWGIALQTILDLFEDMKVLLLSATPINNSPSEIIDLVNILLSKKDKVKKINFFSDRKTLKPGALPKLKKLFIGKVSYLVDNNPEFYPSQTRSGVKIPGINYLKFIRCEMSPLHAKTYKNNIGDTMPQDGRSILDLVFPNPNGPTGLFSTKELRSALTTASVSWKNKNNIEYISSKTGSYITGDFLQADQIGKYSAKYARAIKDLNKLSAKPKSGKVMLYHRYVQTSGVILWREILRKNSYVDVGAEPLPETPCSVCGILFKLHKPTYLKKKKIDDHEYYACRFIIVHSDIERNLRDKRIDKYNSPENSYGKHIKILVGANVIKESYDIKGLMHIWFLSKPDSISMALQIEGRGRRKGSHMSLPPEDRHIEYRYYVSSIPGLKKLSYEEKKWKEKMEEYELIQILDQAILPIAIDAYINRSIIMPNESIAKREKMTLQSIYYEPEVAKKYSIDQLNISTFDAFYSDSEINLIIYIIKRLFIEKSEVWKYEDLWGAVRNPHFVIETNPDFFTEDSFIIALNRLTYYKDSTTENNYTSISDYNMEASLIERLFDPVDKKIRKLDGTDHMITHVGLFYILTPVVDNIPNVDVEMHFRDVKVSVPLQIKISDYIVENKDIFDYGKRKYRFKEKYENLKLDQLSNAICDYNNEFHIKFIEDAITYMFKLWVFPATTKQSEFHMFYIKMLKFYDSLELLIYGNGIVSIDFIYSIYDVYITTNKKQVTKNNKQHLDMYNSDAMLELISSTIDKSSMTNDKFEDTVLSSISSSSDYIKSHSTKKVNKNIKPIKVSSSVLIIGHYVADMPRFYHPDRNWFDMPEYLNIVKSDFKENDIIIGYYEKSKTAIDVKFKIRSPIHQIKQYEDSRLIEKGATCSTKSKEELQKIAKKLSVDTTGGIRALCFNIKTELLKRELKERKKSGPKRRYFYFYFEKQPSE